MTFDSQRRRVESLESASSLTDAILTFPDGSTRAVTFRNKLGVFCTAADRCAHAGPGICEGNEQIPHRTEWHEKPLPPDEFDAAVDLLGRAVSIQSDDRFLKLVHETCQQAVELEKERDVSGEMH